MSRLRNFLYPFLRLLSRVMCRFVPILHRMRLNRLWSLLLRLLPRDGEFIKSVYGPVLFSNPGDHQFYLCATGKSGFKLHDLIARTDRPMTFVDIGANLGLYSLLASENKFFHSVYSIEPNPLNVINLLRNLEKNNARNINVIEAAVSNSAGIVELNYDDSHMGMGSITKSSTHSIKVRSLNREYFDELFSRIDASIFLKIDVEGAEGIVLDEVLNSKISQKIAAIFVEISPKWVDSVAIGRMLAILNKNGFKLNWKSKGDDQYDAYFVKSDLYQLADKSRIGNESAPMASRPKYSICVSNYNMGDTIYRAISSVAEQVDNEFEILILDDGSSDNSRNEIERLQKKYPSIRSIFLDRDNRRKLGETRNLSVYGARGEYVLLHIDADDAWEPYIMDLVKLFHCLEKAYGDDFLLVGQQTGIVRRDFLLETGGYDNVYRGEDRDLMFKLAKLNKILFMDYKTFRIRLKRPVKKMAIKIIWDLWSHLQYDLLCTESRFNYVGVALLLSYNNKSLSFKLRALRGGLVLFALLSVWFKKRKPLAMPWNEFLAYRQSRRGNFSELMKMLGASCQVSSVVKGDAVGIFDYKVSSIGFKGE